MANKLTSWIGSNGNWTVSADWSTGAVPDSSTAVTIAQGDPHIETDVGTIATLTNTAGLDFESGGALKITGKLTNSGTIDVETTADAANASLNVHGIFVNQGNISISATLGGATLTTASINNTGSLSLSGSQGFQAKLDVAGAAGTGALGTLAGEVSLQGNSLVAFEGSGAITTIKGHLSIDGAQAFIAVAGKLHGNSALTGLSSVKGSLTLDDSASVTVSGNLTNAGTIDLQSTSATGTTRLLIGGAFNNQGDTSISATAGNSTLTAASLNNIGSLTLSGLNGHLAKLSITGSLGFGTAGIVKGDISLGGRSILELQSQSQIKTIAGNLTIDGRHAFVASANSDDNNSALSALSSVKGSFTLRNGAALTLPKGLNNSGLIDIDGGTLDIFRVAKGVGTYRLENGGFLEVGAHSSANVTFEHSGLGSTFHVDQNGTFTGSLTGFAAGDQFIVTGARGISYDANAGTISYTLAHGALQTTHVGTGYDASLWQDTSGIISYSGPAPTALEATAFAMAVPCYVSGTLIRTPRGDIPVETLRAGAMILTASGQGRPIVWIGSRTVYFRAAVDSLEHHPYRIRAHAFGANRPARDLWLSPDHAVAVSCLSDVLVPIKHLDNGATIAQVAVDEVTYWHLELEEHDLLLAENLPAESFLDTFGKDFFGRSEFEASKTGFTTRSGRPRADLPRARTWEADACLPLVTKGHVVQALRVQLLKRAEALGWTLSADAALRFEVLGCEGNGDIEVSKFSETFYRLAFPASLGDIVMVSNSFVPRHSDVDTFDDRRLGVPIGRVEIRDIAANRKRDIALDDVSFGAGFHPVQTYDGASWRWTDGLGVIRSSLWAGMTGRVELEIRLATGRGTLRAWVAPESALAESRLAEAIRVSPLA